MSTATVPYVDLIEHLDEPFPCDPCQTWNARDPRWPTRPANWAAMVRGCPAWDGWHLLCQRHLDSLTKRVARCACHQHPLTATEVRPL